MRVVTTTLACLLVATAFVFPSSAGDDSYLRIPLTRLLANPEDHDLKLVLTAGYARNTVRGLFLFLTEGDARHRVYINGILIEIDRNRDHQAELAQRVDGEYASVAGTFDWLGDGASVLRSATEAVVHTDVESHSSAR